MTLPQRPLNIVHVLRAPLGGLFRHVVDLTVGQSQRGHHVGLIADSLTGGVHAEEALAALSPHIELGLLRTPMPRHASWRDLTAVWQVTQRVRACDADVVHGHGAKGGAYARFALAPAKAIRVYTPHGGSLNYDHSTLAGKFYLAIEWLLRGRGDVYTFESAYSETVYRTKIGTPRGLVRVVHNGISKAEFASVPLAENASDLVFLGEFRPAKGINVLIEALAILRGTGRHITATMVGDGPDASAMREHIAEAGLSDAIRIEPPMPAHAALALGRVMVVPSLAESLPYVVLEAAAAKKPLIVTDVGGIPEIYGPLAPTLVPPRNARAFARAMDDALKQPDKAMELADKLRQRVAEGFSLDSMIDGVLAAYQAGLDRRLQETRL